MASNKKLTFQKREFRGSRYRCLLATSQPHPAVAAFINSLTPDEVSVTEKHHWAPQGFLSADEAKLAETKGFLSKTNRKKLESWWLAKPGRANTPNWDLVSTCDYGGKSGLVLVEAKAHVEEFADDRCGAKNRENSNRINKAISEANDAWNAITPGFSLSVDSKYQLSNRFAFAWKVASLGIPVVLIYLGFLNAAEMRGSGRKLLAHHSDWESCVTKGGESRVPREAWNRTFDINGTPLTTIIQSAQVDIHALCTKGKPA